jgi:hypothetical protein
MSGRLSRLVTATLERLDFADVSGGSDDASARWVRDLRIGDRQITVGIAEYENSDDYDPDVDRLFLYIDDEEAGREYSLLGTDDDDEARGAIELVIATLLAAGAEDDGPEGNGS